jgi:hypothetical protein
MPAWVQPQRNAKIAKTETWEISSEAVTHPPGEVPRFFKSLSLCSLRSFAANHFALQAKGF